MDHEIYSDPHLLKLWIHCLMKASYSEREQLVGRQIIILGPGQFVTGREALAREFNAGATKQNIVSAITLWRWLLMFESLQMLNIKKTTKYSVVTVINWANYQKNEQQMNNSNNVSKVNNKIGSFVSESEQQMFVENLDISSVYEKECENVEQQMNNKQPKNEQPMNTNNKVNNKVNNKDMSIQQAEQFSLWWNLYNKKTGKSKCEIKFKQLLRKYTLLQIEEGTKKYLQYMQQNNVAKQFQKNPLTFLNGEHFNDEYEELSSIQETAATNVNAMEFSLDD